MTPPKAEIELFGGPLDGAKETWALPLPDLILLPATGEGAAWNEHRAVYKMSGIRNHRIAYLATGERSFP